MPDSRRRAPVAEAISPLVASAQTYAAGQVSRASQVFQYESWQAEAWDFWRNLGEFYYGTEWLSNALSRVRLTAGELVLGGDEPTPLAEGPAAELMAQFGGGMPGQARIMGSLGTHLSVPGEGWLVAERESEQIPLGLADWSVKSTDAIRVGRGATAGGFEIRVDDTAWRPLSPESLPIRVWKPDEQHPWRAISPARPATPIMRRIDLLDRRIIATLVSRLAMNGILLIPQEGTFTVPEQYKDKDDPFVQMLIDIASNNIRNPGNASAAIPIPIRFTSELIEKWKHLTFGDGVDQHLLEERDKEIGRLATTVNLPAEVLTGMGKTNHWSAWQLEESAIKLHISPLAETIVHGLSVGYLYPMLKAAGQELVGPNGGKIVVWYDTSELTARPDKSQQAMQAYDRLEISGEALRRESGFDDGDKPEADELRIQALKKLLAQPASALTALAELTGVQLQTPSPAPGGPGAGDGNNPPPPDGAPEPGGGAPPGNASPPTRDVPPPPPGGAPPAAGLAQRFTVDLPERQPALAGLRAPPTPSPNGGRHSRDGPRNGSRR